MPQDPYAEFGGKSGADPYADFGGQYRPPGFAQLKARVKAYPKQAATSKEGIVPGIVTRVFGSDHPIRDNAAEISFIAKHPIQAYKQALSNFAGPQMEALKRAEGDIKSGQYGYAVADTLEGITPFGAGTIVGQSARDMGSGKTRSAYLDLYVPVATALIGSKAPEIARITGERFAGPAARGAAEAASAIREEGPVGAARGMRDRFALRKARKAMQANAPIQEAMGRIRGEIPELPQLAEKSGELARREISGGRTAQVNAAKDLANQVAPGGSVEPIEAAKATVRALQTQAGAQKAIEAKMYRDVYGEADKHNVMIDPQQTAKAASEVYRLSAPAQEHFGVSGLPSSDLTGLGKIARATSPEENIRQRFEQLQSELPEAVRNSVMRIGGDELTPNQIEVFAKALGGGPVEIPFQRFDEAQRGIGKLIRTLRMSDNPENASRVAALSRVQKSMQQDIQDTLSAHPEIRQQYNAAHRLTLERHSATDVKGIREYFSSPRNRPAAEKVVEAVLSKGQGGVGTFKEIEDISRGVSFGPETERASRSASDPRIAGKLRKAVANDAIAQRGLKRAVIDAAIKAGTTTSDIAGVPHPEMDFGKMAEYLAERPGARILLGSDYDGALGGFRRLARQALTHDDPAYSSFLEKLAGKSWNEDQIVQKASSDPAFAQRAARLSRDDPQFRQRLAQKVIQRAYDNSMAFGEFGGQESYLSLPAFVSKFRAVEPSLKVLGNPEAVADLRALVDTTAKLTKIGKAGSTRPHLRFFQPIAKFIPTGGHAYLSSPLTETEYVITAKDLARAATDPRLAHLLRVASETPSSSPSAPGIAAAIQSASQGDANRKIEIHSESTLPPIPGMVQ